MTAPNFVFILIDDMGWRDLACCGSSFYETPNIDRLCAQGVRFTHAYATCPVCSPSRASILTGRYPARVGVTDYIGGNSRGRVISAPYTRHLPAEEFSLARALKRGGYSTWHVGKWHLGGREFWPERHGFDLNVGGCDMGHPRGGYFSPWDNPMLPDGPEGEYLTDRLTDEAVRLIRQGGDAPFFLNLWYYSVHTPIQAKEPDIRRFRAKAEETGVADVEAFETGEFFPCEHKRDGRVRRRLLQSDPAYAAMIWALDENVGRLMAALEEAGRADDTVVIFTSDNGGLATAEGAPTCNAPLAEGKGWMYEGGTREPLIVRAPGTVPAATTCTVPVTGTDFYPTLLEMAGLDPLPEQHCDGVSLVPLLGGGGELEREAVYWHYPHYGNQGGTPGCSVRAGDHKLIEFFEDNRLELYDLAADPSERRNLSQEQPGLARDLHARLVSWREEVGARIPQPNPDWRD
ncbi:MAG: sulfatase [Planctomycetota bacterium]|jgi:arylsulfatase A-like enzyme